MTLLTTATKQSFACDGVTQDFPISLTYFATTDLQVLLRDGVTGAEVLLSVEADYQVTGQSEASATLHTTVIYPPGKTLTLLRRTGLVQAIDYAENDPFPAAVHERALDLAAARAQDLAEGLDRALRIGATDSGSVTLPPAEARRGKALVFDANGNVAVSDEDFVGLVAATAAAADSAAIAGAAQAAAEAARDLAQTYGAALSGTSVTALTIGGGGKTLATQGGKAWILGQRLRAASGDGTKVMDGEVTAYAGASLTLDVDYTEGSGSHADWSISLVGERGPVGAGSSANLISFVPAGNLSALDVQVALQELDSEKLATSGGTLTGGLNVGSVAGDGGLGWVNAKNGFKLDGVSISPIGRQTIAVPASAMLPRLSAGAGTSLTETSGNKIVLATLDFDPASSEYAQLVVPMPKGWNESTVSAQFVWTASATGNVVWLLNAVALSDDDPADAAVGSAQSVTDGVTAAGDIMISAETAAATIGGTPTEGDLVVFQVGRDAAIAGDTCAVDARLIALRLYYTTSAATDA